MGTRGREGRRFITVKCHSVGTSTGRGAWQLIYRVRTCLSHSLPIILSFLENVTEGAVLCIGVLVCQNAVG